MHSDQVKKMPISEFRERGYLHEVNRLVLHPLGLALEVKVAGEAGLVASFRAEDLDEILPNLDRCVELLRCGSANPGVDADVIEKLAGSLRAGQAFEKGEVVGLGGVWDCQDDPEGITYGEDLLSAEKAERVCAELLERREERKKHTGGWVIQPIPDRQVLSTTYTDPELRTSGGEAVVVEPGKFAGVEMPEDERPECCDWCGNEIPAGEAEYDDDGTPYCGACWEAR